MARKLARRDPPIGPEELFEFWRAVMNGTIVKEVNGGIAEEDIPLELRMRASENLARYIVVKPKSDTEDDREATVTPDVLRLAQLLEERASVKEIAELMEQGGTR